MLSLSKVKSQYKVGNYASFRRLRLLPYSATLSNTIGSGSGFFASLVDDECRSRHGKSDVLDLCCYKQNGGGLHNHVATIYLDI
jgi:hypothetical protein